MRPWARIGAVLFGPVDPVRLDTYRRVVALVAMVYVSSRAIHPLEWLTEQGFHYSAAAHNYWEPTPFPLLPVPLVAPFLAVFGLALASMVVGRWVRGATAVALGCVFYVTFADTASAFTINRLLIVIFSVLLVAPSPVTLGPDGRLGQSAWPIRILQATLVIQLTTAGWCKINRGDWLENSAVVWSQVQGYYMTDLAAWMVRTIPKELWAPMQHSSLGFEILAPILFLVRPLRPLAILWGLAFHGMIALTMHKIVFLSAAMVSFYVLFLDERILIALRDRARAMWTELWESSKARE